MLLGYVRGRDGTGLYNVHLQDQAYRRVLRARFSSGLQRHSTHQGLQLRALDTLTGSICEAAVMALLGVSTEVILAALAGGMLLFVYFLYKHFYVHYQLLKSHGIKGPKPVPYFGNALNLAKLVC